MSRYVLVKRFCELTGYTDRAVRCKLNEGVFVEGVHYKRSPDNHIQIDMEAYQRWVEGAPAPALSR